MIGNRFYRTVIRVNQRSRELRLLHTLPTFSRYTTGMVYPLPIFYKRLVRSSSTPASQSPDYRVVNLVTRMLPA